MSYNPWDQDDPLRRMMRHMDELRRVTEHADILRRAAGDFEWLTQSGSLEEIKRQATTALELKQQFEERQDLLRELGERREILRDLEERLELQRKMAEGSNLASLYGNAMRETSTIGDLFFQHRGLIDGYIFDTFYGTGTSWIASSPEPFQRTNEKLAESYEDLGELVESDEGKSLPSIVKTAPPVEVFASAEVVKPPEDDEEEKTDDREERRQLREELCKEGRHQLRPALVALEPELATMWEGGSLALTGSNPDRIRHYSASRRELMTHVLHMLAPDKEIRQWNSDSALYHNGRPTRRARILYICRSISSEPFKNFVESNCRLMLETLDLYQEGTHALKVGFTDEQLSALETRMDQHLLFLLQVASWRN